MEGLTEVTVRGAGLLDVLGSVGVLAAYGELLLAVAAWQLRRSLLTSQARRSRPASDLRLLGSAVPGGQAGQ